MLTPPAQLEAILFASGEAVNKKRLASLLGITPALLTQAADVLRSQLVSRGIALVETDEAFELRTHPQASELIKKLRDAELSRDLGKAGLETLAIVLYTGGATRGDIDWVRGVNSTQTLRSLMMRGLVERAENPDDTRRPRYVATVEALAHLGVSRREELPQYAELSELLSSRQAAASDAS